MQSLIRHRHDASEIDFRQRGDVARDLRKWLEASIQYEAYLTTRPDDAAIWVRLGQVLIENRELDRAEAAFGRARELIPDDAELVLEIGNLLKVSGRIEEAAAHYAEAIRMSPSEAAREALLSLGSSFLSVFPPGQAAAQSKNAIYIQINDFLFYLKHHKTVSGIQRVQLGMINHVIGLGDTARNRLSFVFSPLRGTGLRAVECDKIRAVVDYLAAAEVDHDRLRELIEDAMATASPVSVNTGDVFFVLGAFWGLGGCVDLLRLLKGRGVKTGILFYDLIPVTHPEFCEDQLSADFLEALLESLCFVDFGLAISEHTADEVRRFLQRYDLPALPMAATPLAHNLQASPRAAASCGSGWPESLSELKGKPYVLCVSTIEARKNHRYLFDAWKALAAERADLPDLVLVGRRGWRVEDLFAQFKATNYLDGRIKVYHDLSDGELAALYRGCVFTVFPSVVEGWGLPIGESLSYGKVCVASNTSSMPEVGGDLVEYIDPWNLRAGLDVFRRLITDSRIRQEREAEIRARFKPRDWQAVSTDCLENLETLAANLNVEDRPAFIPVLPAGQLFRPARPATGTNSSAKPAIRERMKQLALHDRWHRPEDFGTWMDGSEAEVTFLTGTGRAEAIVVFLRLSTVPWVEDNSLSIHDAHAKLATVSLVPSDIFIVRVKTSSDPDGRVALRFRVHGKVGPRPDDKRALSVGLTKLAYAAADDAATRVEIMEALTWDHRLSD